MRRARDDKIRLWVGHRAVVLVLLVAVSAFAMSLLGPRSAAAAQLGPATARPAFHCGLNARFLPSGVLARRCPFARHGIAASDKAAFVPVAGQGRMSDPTTRRYTVRASGVGAGAGDATSSAEPSAPSGHGSGGTAKTHPTPHVKATIGGGLFPDGLPEIEIETGPTAEVEPGHTPEPKGEPEHTPEPESELEPEPEPEGEQAPEGEPEPPKVEPGPPAAEPERESEPENEIVESIPVPSHGSQPTWFAATSVWNRELPASVPPAPESSSYVAELVDQVNSAGAWINTEEYSTPVYTVGVAQPRVLVEMISWSPGGYVPPTLEKAFALVPIPPGARPAAGTDKHLVVWQPSTDEMWEFWGLREEGGKWLAAYGGAMKGVSDSPGYYSSSSWPGAEAGWGATATSLPLLGGLITIKQFESLKIEHALAMAIPDPGSRYVWPAQRGDGRVTGAGAIPEGTIFRLPMDLNLEDLGLTPVALAIAEAAQKYGMVVRDTSGCVSLYGEASTAAGASPYTKIFGNEMPSVVLANFPWADLVAIQPGN